uniref:hypothetical protein n=1 Tax=uncultured Maribacter sp. TaxID=431308 RepID=UPI0030DD455F
CIRVVEKCTVIIINLQTKSMNVTYWICKTWRGKTAHNNAKRNADLRAKPKGLCIFIKSLNLWDLALEQKNKTKPKALASCAAGNKNVSLLPHYA